MCVCVCVRVLLYRSRTRFILETISALKSNNSRKIPNHDPSLTEHMRRLTRGLIHSKGLETLCPLCPHPINFAFLK